MKIENLEIGDSFAGRFLLTGKEEKKKRSNGEEFLILYLQDDTGKIEGRIWEKEKYENVELEEKNVFAIKGQTVEYQGSPQIKVKKVKKSPKQNIENFLPNLKSIPGGLTPKDGCYKRILKMIDNHCSNDHILELLGHFLGFSFEEEEIQDEERVEKLCKYPAAKRNHHSYRGGLIHHIFSMMKVSNEMVNHYNHLYDEEIIDKDKVFAGVILHDLGKIEEYDDPVSPSFSQRGELEAHISIMCEKLHSYKVQSEIEDSLYREIKHLILSHHGKLDWGSPVEPKTVEATLLHRIDMMDSRVAKACENYLDSDKDEFSLPNSSKKMYKKI